MNDNQPTYVVGEVATFPERQLCHCGDGTPHYHAYQAMWDGSKWCAEGTGAWDKAVADFTRVCEQTGLIDKLRKE